MVVILLVVLIVGDIEIGGGGTRYDLDLWGVFDEDSSFQSIIEAYEAANQNIRINYRNFSIAEYETAVLNAITEGKAPDIWMVHNSWLPKYKEKLLPLPQPTNSKDSGYRINNFKNDFVDVTFFDFTDGKEIYAMPLYADTLALYYNNDFLQSAGFTRPPSTWDEFKSVVQAISKIDAFSNKVERSAAAMGTSRNINRSTDILTLLMLQSGVRMTDNSFTTASFANPVDGLQVGQRALEFYTDFANPFSSIYTWNNDLDYSIDAFSNSDTAMMINYSHHISTIRAKSPRLNFAIASVPQMNDSNVLVNYANYFGLAVPKLHASDRQLEAWKFIVFATSNEGQKLYTQTTHRPPARRDLIEEIKNDFDLGVFAIQAITARSWYQVDSGAIEKIFADMIDAVNFGQAAPVSALQSAQTKVNVLMQKVSR